AHSGSRTAGCQSSRSRLPLVYERTRDRIACFDLRAWALQNKTAIVGIGCTEFSANSGRTEYQLALEAAVAACRDAGISPHEIDCITLSSYQSETVDEAELINGLGTPNVSHLGLVGHGGGAPCAVVGHAALAVATGMAETALCLR